MEAPFGGGDADAVLRLARAEAARWHHRTVTLTHVASVMANLYPVAFDLRFGRFGRFGRELISDLLRAGTSCGSLATATALLRRGDTVERVVVALHEFLAFPEVLVDRSEREDHERWLVLQILDRLRAYRRKREGVVLDELYVLIAALRVVEFDDAHEAMKTHLREATR